MLVYHADTQGGGVVGIVDLHNLAVFLNGPLPQADIGRKGRLIRWTCPRRSPQKGMDFSPGAAAG